MELGGGFENVCLVPLLFLVGTDDDRVRRDQRFESFCIVGEPGTPDGFTGFEKFRAVVGTCGQARYEQDCE